MMDGLRQKDPKKSVHFRSARPLRHSQPFERLFQWLGLTKRAPQASPFMRFAHGMLAAWNLLSAEVPPGVKPSRSTKGARPAR